MPKSTDAEIEQRVTAVYKLLLRGASRESILQNASRKAWNVDPRSVDTYIARARARLQEQAASVRDEELGKAIARLNLLFRLALKAGDLRTALRVQKELNTLLDLYVPDETSLKRTLAACGLSPMMLANLLVALKRVDLEGSQVFEAMLARLMPEVEDSDGRFDDD